MNNFAKKFYFVFISILLTLGLSISLQSLLAAWVSPSANPPAGNVSEPVNVGAATQTKTGGLIINGKIGVGNITLPDMTSLANLEGDNNVEMKVYSNSAIKQAQITFGRWDGVGNDWSSIGPEGSTFDIWSQILPITFVTGAATNERLRISQNGNVGIGTNSPQDLLEIGNSQNSNVRLAVTNTYSGNVGAQVIARNDYTLSSGAMRMLVLSTGYTTSGGFVQDGAALDAGDGLSGGLSIMSRNSGSGSIRFYTGGYTDTNKRMTIDTSGNVTINNSLCLGGVCKNSWPPSINGVSINDGSCYQAVGSCGVFCGPGYFVKAITTGAACGSGSEGAFPSVILCCSIQANTY